ncbi:MAG: hypothetical protein L3J53_02955 [Proteobacteria bacterium]|nr:hypothetical protein [Pseudomonadota bacterium]
MKLPIILVCCLTLTPTVVFGEKDHSHVELVAPSGVESLSQDLRDLLTKEMKFIQTGMMSIIPLYASGNWSEIEATAKKIKNSYILKQSLSDSQVKELHSSLPKEFIVKDNRFHYLAGMLEHAAKNKKPELVNFYFSEMNESCASCHSVFATHKFPNFKEKTQKEHVH